MSYTVKAMSFNLWVGWDNGGDNSFLNRRERILKVIENEDPDVIGFQEASDAMRLWLKNELKGYTVIGCGRGKNYSGEAAAIAFKHDKFDLLATENFWLSPTPKIPGTRFDGQSTCPRVSQFATLVSKELSKPFVFANTHLDHVGSEARVHGNMLNAQYLSTRDEKFIFTGDFNAYPESPEITMFKDALAYRGVTDCAEDCGGTFHGCRNIEARIDYIFTDAHCLGAYVVPDENPEGLFYSDHHAVCAVIELE